MATFVTVEIDPPCAIFTRDLDPIIVWIHSDIALVGSAAATIFFQKFSDVGVMADFLTDIWIQASVSFPGRVLDVACWCSTPFAAMATRFFHFQFVFVTVHHPYSPAPGFMGAIVVFIKNITHVATSARDVDIAAGFWNFIL